MDKKDKKKSRTYWETTIVPFLFMDRRGMGIKFSFYRSFVTSGLPVLGLG